MKLLTLAIGLCLLLTISLPGSDVKALSATQTPDDVAAQVDKLFAKWDKKDSPGCAIGIVRDGRLVYARGYGMASIDHQVSISTRTVFNLHSISKSFVAMSIAMLVKQGKLSFDDDVRKYVPEFPNYGTPVTIRHLLQHTSGLPDVGNLVQSIGWRDDERMTEGQLLEIIVRQKALNHAPGEAFSYSNSGMVLLPLVVKRVTGKTMRDFLKEQIFAPLGMTETQYRDDANLIIHNRANGYRAAETGGYSQSRSATDNIFSTVEDMVRWGENFYTATVGGKEVLDWMRTPTRLNSGTPTEHGRGLYFINYRGYDAIYHGGDGADGHTFFAQFPALRFSVILLSNASDANVMNLAIQVMDIYLKNEFEAAERKQKPATASQPPTTPRPPAPMPVPARQLEQYAGTYFSTDGSPMIRRFVIKDGALKWRRDNGKETPLVSLGEGRFQVEGDATVYAFEAAKAGGAVTLRRIIEGDRTRTFEKVKDAAAESLSLYAGRYYSDELDAHVEFVARDGKLFYRWPRQVEVEALESVFADGFRDANNLFFHFHRDTRGQVTGLSFHQDRIWRLHYVRIQQPRK